jgi:hypothetical protein
MSGDVGIRIEGQSLLFFDLDTRELLRTGPIDPPGKVRFLRGVRPAGPPYAAFGERSPSSAARRTAGW